MYCIYCGSKMPNGAKFCPICGANQVEPTETSNENVRNDVEQQGEITKKTVDVSKGGKKIVLLSIAAIVIVFLVFIFGGGSSEDPESSEPVISESEYCAMCEAINYKELFRNSPEHKGSFITFKVQIAQTIDPNGKTSWRAYTVDEALGLRTTEELLLTDDRADGTKVLNDDVLIIYGEYQGLKEVTRAFGNIKEEVPHISVKYINIVEN